MLLLAECERLVVLTFGNTHHPRLRFHRLDKERVMNEKEVEQQEKRIAKMKEEGRDEYDIKKQVRSCVLCLVILLSRHKL